MKTLSRTFFMCGLFASSLAFFSGCDDEDEPQPQLTGNATTYPLSAVTGAGVSGTVTFAERDDDQILITLQLNGTQAGATHPAHIHTNTAIEGGDIVLSLADVNGADGKSETIVNALDDGTALTYDDLLSMDGHVNVHMSANDLTIIAQGDIGGNELLTDNKVYTLTPVAEGAAGTATFTKRKNGTTLVTVAVTGTEDGATHPSHIHANTVAEGGGIVIDLNNVDGTSGIAHTNVRQLNDGTPITYEELLDFNGYLNVHAGSSFVVQGDIGQNEFTGEEHVYEMTPVADPAVSGTASFAERANGTTLVTVALTNTVAGETHASHIHANTVAEGGGIVIDLNSVDGTTGMARTNVRQLNDGTPITYAELLDFNGYLNVHAGSSFVAQADIGQNELTGEETVYTLNEVAGSGVTGTATFAERKSGKTQITLALTGTVDGGDHPAHIHANDAATGGGIVLDLENVNGATGMSVTSANKLNDETEISYAELIDFDGYINVHQSPANLGTLVAQGDIGSNAP